MFVDPNLLQTLLSLQPANTLTSFTGSLKMNEIELVSQILTFFQTSQQNAIFKLSKESGYKLFRLGKPVELKHLSIESVSRFLEETLEFQNQRMAIREFIRNHVNSNLVVV
jgi:hypothetical protein